MFKSIQTKIVAIFLLTILSVVVVIGAFLTTNIMKFYNDEFSVMMEKVFTPGLVSELEKSADASGTEGVWDIVSSYMGPLGIDTYRFYSILDAKTGNVLKTSDPGKSVELEKSDNIIVLCFVGDKIQLEYSLNIFRRIIRHHALEELDHAVGCFFFGGVDICEQLGIICEDISLRELRRHYRDPRPRDRPLWDRQAYHLPQ